MTSPAERYGTPDTGAAPDPSAQVHLGVFYPGVGPQLLWADSTSHTSVATFVEVVTTLERGLFDAFFLGDGQRLRENRGKVYELDISGRPDSITQLAALAAVTERIGLVATQNTTYSYPADLARRLAGLDHLSSGRAGWNVVTTDNAWTGGNFRRPGWLEHERRYDRAGQFVEAAKELWGAPVGATIERHTDLVDFRAVASVPRSAQGRPVLFQAGDSDGGRELAATHADVVFSANTAYDKAVAYAVDLRARLRRLGRSVEAVRILPGAGVVLGATRAEAEDKARWIHEQTVSPARALAFFEQYWGTDLSSYDPFGPLPDIEPAEGELDPSRGTLSIDRRTGKHAQVQAWRELSKEQGLSIVDLARQVQLAHPSFIGTPGEVAEEWAHYVRTRAVDGFNITPYQLPGQLTEVVDLLVPELQERGVYRTAYEGTTLRDHLALPAVADEVVDGAAGVVRARTA